MVLGSLILGCSSPSDAPVKYLIGVSQANLSEPWRIVMTDEIQRQASLHPDLRVIVTDASDSLGKQIGDVEKFEGLGVDLMIISPLESEALTPTVTRIYQKMPVIVVNRSVANYDYTLFIGPDNAKIGQEAGRFVAHTLNQTGGAVLEVLGRSGSPPTLERAQGFRLEIAKNPRIRLQSAVLANWLRDGAEDLVLERLTAEDPPKVIFAHNDAMAYGAWLAAQKLGLTRKITFLGVDGLPGPQGGLELMRSGILDATFVSPTGGKEAVEYALAILHHQGELPKKVILGTKFLTRRDLDRQDPALAPASSTRTVAYWGPSAPTDWCQRLGQSVEAAFRAKGWNLLAVGSAPLPVRIDALVDDGSDLTAADRALRGTLEAEAERRGIPVVRLGPQPGTPDTGSWTLALGPDTREEGLRAGRWLAGAGVSRVLELSGPPGAAGARERAAGLALGLAAQKRLVSTTVFVDGTRAATRRAVAEALGRGIPFDSIFAPSDEMTLGALDAMRDGQRQARPPLKVVGVGGGPEVRDALAQGDLTCLVRSPSDLGTLVWAELSRALGEQGVPRRLVTSHDVLVH